MTGYIRQVPLSYLLAASTTVFLLFITTFGGSLFAPAIIMYMLIMASLVLNRDFVKKEDAEEPTQQEFGQIGLYALFGLITFFILNLFVPELQFASGQSVTINLFTGTNSINTGAIWSSPFIAAFIFTVFLVPIAEENFFRVLIGNIALKYLPFFIVIPIIGAAPIVAIFVVGTVFSTFHFAAYGLNWTNLIILWGAGSALFSLDIAVGNPLPSQISHSLNNALAMLLSSTVLVSLFPTLGQFSPHLINPILQLTMIGLVALRGIHYWTRKSR